jgi:hypothetical protein
MKKSKFIFSDIPLFPGGRRKLFYLWSFWPKTKCYKFEVNIAEIIDFYKREMPKLKWKLVDERKPYKLEKRGIRAYLAFRKEPKKVFISMENPIRTNQVRVEFLLVPPCPFEIGDMVEFRPSRRFASTMQYNYKEQRVYPGYVGKVTEIRNDMVVYLEGGRAGFPWGEFKLVKKAREGPKNKKDAVS